MFVVLALVLAYVAVQSTTMLHEAGHARAALKAGAQGVYVDIGRGRYRLCPPWVARALRIRGADVWFAPGIERGFCGHSEILGRDDLLKLYRAGWRATLIVAVLWPIVAALLFVATVLCGAGTTQTILVFLLILITTFHAPLTTAGNALHKKAPVNQAGANVRQHGSDAWHVKQIKSDVPYSPPLVPTADTVKARPARKNRVL